MPPAPSTRRRLIAVLFAAVGLDRIGFLLAVTVATLAAEDMLGSALWAGLPAALGVTGMALATTPMSSFMGRHGRRPGMVLGQTLVVAGALTAAVAVNVGSFLLLIAAFVVFGIGNSADRLARYAAADVAAPERRGSAIALVVWAGTVGSVIGPALLEPTQELAESLAIAGLAGPYVVAGVAYTLAAVVIFLLLRPDPLSLVPDERPEPGSRPVPVLELLRIPKLVFAIVALVVGQVVMVLIMTMTPIHIRSAGQSLGIVGLVISAHTLGMFALSPLTGWLADRLGRLPVVLVGEGLLMVSAVMASFAAGDQRALLVASLFLLGLGWNFGFVAGSALVVEDVAPDVRLRAQGVADAFVWLSGAVATFGSGLILAVVGFRGLSLLGALLVLVPPALLIRLRRASPATA